MLGPDAAAQFQQYNQDLLNSLSTLQFSAKLTGTKEEKAQKKEQFYQAMKEATQTVLSQAGLPADYQAVPMLNFRNIASEEQGNRSVQLLDNIYARVAAQAGSFLSPAELESFSTYRKMAIANSRTAIQANRTMMAPMNK